MSLLAHLYVGHTLIQGVCNTPMRPTSVVSGVDVGHFGKNHRIFALQ